MGRSITMPEGINPVFVDINGKKYQLEAGKKYEIDTDIPAEVAELIENNSHLYPQEDINAKLQSAKDLYVDISYSELNNCTFQEIVASIRAGRNIIFDGKDYFYYLYNMSYSSEGLCLNVVNLDPSDNTMYIIYNDGTVEKSTVSSIS